MRPRAPGRRAGAGLAVALALAWCACARAAALPDWAAQAVARPTPDWAAGAPAVRLLDEETITVPATGRVRILTRGAVRILSSRGRDYASCSASYLSGTTAVRWMTAWVVGPSGQVRRLDGGDAVDRSLAGAYTLYSESRTVEMSAAAAAVGSVFAWEYATEEEPLLAQWPWFFQIELPSLLSRVSLTLPEGVEPVAMSFGPDSVSAQRQGRTWTWEMRDVKPAAREPLAPHAWSVQSSVMLGVRADGPKRPGGASFADWAAVARWVGELEAGTAGSAPEITARAAALAAGVADTLGRLRALARAVQRLNYVAVNLDLGHGGGYRPNAAAEVLRLGYGDCKDKANLLRALVEASGTRAWLMSAYLGDRDRVDERWPSPLQFNHCITVMSVPRGTRLPAAFEHPVFGTLLAFDPTDPLTVFGDLRQDEQGALGLVVASPGGGLVRLPLVPPDAGRLERRMDATLDAEGDLVATLHEASVGQQAVAERRFRRELSEAEYRRTLESWLAAGGRSVDLHGFRTEEDTLAGRFDLRAEYAAPRFARSVQSRLILRAALVTPRLTLTLPDSARVLPVALEGQCVVETVTVALPEGYQAEELPAALHDHRDFAELDADWRVEGGVLRFVRRWLVRPLTLPPARYREVREMLAGNLAASQSPVVLVRR